LRGHHQSPENVASTIMMATAIITIVIILS